MMRKSAVFLFLLCPLQAQDGVVISQIYGGGGNSGATLKNDFIELFNRGAAMVDLSGWSVEYGTAARQITPLSGAIPPGRYYLIQEAAGAAGTRDLPTPDAAGSIPMSATAGQVTLTRGGEAIDTVAYSGLSNTTAYARRRNGCGDFQIAAPNPRNRASPPNDCALAQRSATISQIQGPGEKSPLEGELVDTTGIVTARKSNGFYIQSRPQDDDNDPATSEGLFVFTQSVPPAVAAAGNLVRILGIVSEFKPASDPESPTLTELTDPSITVLATGQTLPEPVTVRTLSLESFEGMRVRFEKLRVVGPSGGAIDEANARAGNNGIFWTVPDGAPRPFALPGVLWPLLRVDTAGRLASSTGMLVENLTGNVDYGARAYTIFAEIYSASGEPVRGSAAAPAPGELAIATMNLRRLFDTVDDPDTLDSVLTPEAYFRRLDTIAEAIRDRLHSPGLIAVQEVENIGVIQALAARIGTGYRGYLERGNDIGGIDVGFIVDTDRLLVLDVRQESRNSPLHDRPPLVMRIAAGDLRFSAIAVHMRSLINADSPDVQEKRLAQARDIAAIARRQTDPSIVLGDFNDYSSGEVLKIIQSTGLQDPGDAHTYTYVENGVAGALDHILIDPALRPVTARFEVVHLNADFPPSIAFSDHDVPVATLSTTRPDVAQALVPAASRLFATHAGAGSHECRPGRPRARDPAAKPRASASGHDTTSNRAASTIQTRP